MKSYVWVWTITSQFLQVVWDRCPIYVLGLCFSSFTSILPSSRRLSFLPWVFSALLLNISWLYVLEFKGFPVGSDGKESTCSAADLCLISGLGRSPGKGNGNPLLYSCLENSLNRGAWWVTVYRVTKSNTTEWLTLILEFSSGLLFSFTGLCMYFMPVLYCFFFTTMALYCSLKAERVILLVIFFVLRMDLTIWGLLWFHTHFMIVSSTSVKNAFDIFMVTVLNLKITLGSVKLKNSHNLKVES